MYAWKLAELDADIIVVLSLLEVKFFKAIQSLVY